MTFLDPMHLAKRTKAGMRRNEKSNRMKKQGGSTPGHCFVDLIAMAMHHRRNNPATGGANPFTGRSLPSSSGGRGGGGGYHGNTPSLLPSMAKKTVFLVCTLTIFFYVLFAPEYDDVPYEASRPQQKKESVTKNSDAINSEFVDLSKMQSEPVKLNLPEITSDPQDIIDIEEKELESADNESKRLQDLQDEDEDEEGKMEYDSNDHGEQSADNNTWEDHTAHEGEQLSPAEKIYGAHVYVDEKDEGEFGDNNSQSDPFLGLGDESEEKEDEKADSNDITRGGLRGSISAENKDPFGRQEKIGDDSETKEEEGEEPEVVESSQDDPVNIVENTTFYKNQSPLEMPVELEDESIKSTGTKSMEDAINEQETDSVMNVAINKNETIVADSAQTTFDEANNSEDFSKNGKAAFEAKYGNASKSMEEELNAENALESDEFKNQSPLEIPIGDASDVTGLNQTEVGQSAEKDDSGLSMEERLDTLPKSMADEVEKEEKISNDEDVEGVKNEDSGDDLKTIEAKEENANDEDKDEVTKNKQDSSELGEDIHEDAEVNKGASTGNNFKEYLITDSEDEPKKDEKNSEGFKPASGKSKDIEERSIVKDGNNSKDDEAKELSAEEKDDVEESNESVKGDGSEDASVQGDDVDVDSKGKKNVDDKKSEDSLQESKMDLSDNEAVASHNETLTSDVHQSKDSGAEDEEKVEEPDKTVKIIDGDISKDDESKELGTEDKVEDTDESVKDNRSNDASLQGNVVDEDSKAKKKSEDDSQEADVDLIDNEAVSSLNNETLTSDAGESADSRVEDEKKVEEPDQTPKVIEGSNYASEPGEDSDKDIKDDKPDEISEHIEDEEEDPKGKKKSSIRGASVDKKSKYKSIDDLQKVEKDEEDLNLSSPEAVQAYENDVADEEGKVEDNDKPLKKKGSNDASEQGDKATKDSKAKKAESIRGASDKKSSKVKDDADDATDEEGKETAADKTAHKSEKTSGLGDDADKESKVKSNGGSKDESQELNTDLGDSQALSNNGNKTLDQIEKSEGASKSVEGAEVNGDDKEEGGADVDSKKVKKASIISNLVGSIKGSKGSDVVKEDKIDAKAKKLAESEEDADETTAQNEDTKSLDSLEGASKDKNNDESDSPEKVVKVEDDVKYAKVASDSKEPAANEHASDDKETDEQVKVKKSKVKKSESEESAVNKDEKAIPILGDLGEAIKESDATLDNDETITDKKDPEDTQTTPSNGKGDKDEEAGSKKKKNDEQLDAVADTKELVVGEEKTVKKDKKRKEKK